MNNECENVVYGFPKCGRMVELENQLAGRTEEYDALVRQLEDIANYRDYDVMSLRVAGKVLNDRREKAEIEATRLLLENERLREALRVAQDALVTGVSQHAQCEAYRAVTAALKEKGDE